MENILYDSKFGKVTFTRNSSNDCVIMIPLSNTIIFYPLHNFHFHGSCGPHFTSCHREYTGKESETSYNKMPYKKSYEKYVIDTP